MHKKMENQGLRKTTIVFFVCFLSLFITNRLIDVFVERTEVNFLIVSCVKLILTFFIFQSLGNEQKKVSSFIKNWPIFSLITIVVAYFSYSNTQNIIESKNLDISHYFHASYIFKSFATGFFEEILCRVFLFYSLVNSNLFTIENRVFKSYITSSLIFAFCHITNLFHYDIFSVINQILLAFGLGLIFQILFTKYKNLLFIASLHTLINYFGMRSSTLFQVKSIAEDVELTNVLFNVGIFIFLDSIILFYVYLYIKKRV
jgi:membrane protease YdiL (CAAX protease family)